MNVKRNDLFNFFFLVILIDKKYSSLSIYRSLCDAKKQRKENMSTTEIRSIAKRCLYVQWKIEGGLAAYQSEYVHYSQKRVIRSTLAFVGSMEVAVVLLFNGNAGGCGGGAGAGATTGGSGALTFAAIIVERKCCCIMSIIIELAIGL
jgi:hypothetical protein